MNFKQALADAAKQGPAEKAELITLNEYVDRVAVMPSIAATAHERIFQMIRAAGWSPSESARAPRGRAQRPDRGRTRPAAMSCVALGRGCKSARTLRAELS